MPYKTEDLFPMVPPSYKSGTKNLLCDAQTDRNQLIAANITLLSFHWPLHVALQCLCCV